MFLVEKNDTGTLDTVEEYNVKRRHWRSRSNMPIALTKCQSNKFLENNILLIGGMSKDGKISKDVNIYNTKLNQWYSGNSINTARMGFGVTIIDNKIYIAGGTSNSGLLDTIETGDIEVLEE